MQVNGDDTPTHDAVPLAPSLDAILNNAHMPRRLRSLDGRVLWTSAWAVLVGIGAAIIAHFLAGLIGLVTNLAFYGRVSTAFVDPAGNHLGFWVIIVPPVGGLIVGIMARWGSTAIRGHGIPEAMEQVLRNESRIPPRITWLKPVSSALAIGTGGPFGAEGPIIATGGALGSLLGQLTYVSADERKTLLAAGAAAGMAAVFAAPVSAVLLAIELLLFERRARSLVPVALATVTATIVRYSIDDSHAIFAMTAIAEPGLAALVAYVLLGTLLGAIGAAITKLTYGIERAFEKLPIHFMWWPALGGLVVGVIGYIMPQTLGVGYDNIASILNGELALGMLMNLCLLKLLSWSIALGSGTSGGTLAPLFTIGGGIGCIAGLLSSYWLPWLNVDPRVAALVGMAALFAGASRAFLTSVVFAFETTQQPHGLLPLLGGCAAAYLVSGLLMRNTIMTEKIVRRGLRVPSDYIADYLDRLAAGDVCSRNVVSLMHDQSLPEVRKWLETDGKDTRHQGFPVLGTDGRISGVVTRRDLLDARPSGATVVGDLVRRSPLVVMESHSAREAADHMVEEDVGRLIVIADDDPWRMVGIITRGDLLAAHKQRLREAYYVGRHLSAPTRTNER